MFESHPRFAPPGNKDQPVWRYMDFPKFVSLVDRGALFFPAASRLGDPFEGSYSRANLALRPTWYGEHANSIEIQSAGLKLELLDSTLVSCWHMNDSESMAMWRMYAATDYGIAIRSTYDRLCQSFSLPQPLYIGTVRYIDYDSDPMPEDNLFNPFLHKRGAFDYERELRAVAARFVPPGTVETWSVDEGPPVYDGDYVSADLDVLIDAVQLAPGMPRWFAETVRHVAQRFGITAPVLVSRLDDRPVY
jgi:hypothetical protein